MPYALNVVELTDGPMTCMGRKMLDTAFRIWGGCLAARSLARLPARDRQAGISRAGPKQQWLDREIHEAAQRARRKTRPDHGRLT